MADQNLTSPSVAKRGRRFTPTVRGRGRPTRPATPDEGSPAPSQTPETPTEQAATSSSSKSIGHIRPDSNNEGRLPSVHEGQRTRGGAIKLKFKPTIPTKRNKKEVPSSAIDEALKQAPSQNDFGSDRGRGRGRGHGRGRGRGRGMPAEEMTATGIFSLGPSAMSSRGRNAYAGGGYAMYSGDTTTRADDENGEDTDMLHLFGDNPNDYTPVVFEHIPRTAGDLDPNDMTVKPKKVPWITIETPEDDTEQAKEKEEQVKIKAEPSSPKSDAIDVDASEDKKDQKNSESTRSQPSRPRQTVLMDEDAPARYIFGLGNNNEVVSIADDELLFFQLPSILPRFEKPLESKADEDEEMTDKVKSEPGTEDKGKGKAADNKDKEKSLPSAAQRATLEEAMAGMDLNSIPEGQIGSLVIYKSGKIKMKFGNILLDVRQGMRSTFLEDVAIVDVESKERKKIIQLGHIVQKFVCLPDMDVLLQNEEE